MGPRNIAGPVVRGRDHWGREREVDAAWHLLERGSVLLTGPRRSGKSSLMSALEDAPRDGWTVVYLDVEYVQTPSEFLTELTAALLQQDTIGRVLSGARRGPSMVVQWVSSVLDEVGVGAGGVGELKLKLRERLPDGGAWREVAEQVLVLLERVDGRLLLIVDEFPMMLGNFLEADEPAALRFLQWFRAQRQGRRDGALRFLLGGSVNIEPRLERLSREALLNDLQRLRMEPLDTGSAERFVEHVLVEEEAPFERGVPGEVVRAAGAGAPFFLQVLIEECIAEALRRGVSIDGGLVRAVYEHRVLGPANRARFSHYHSRLREHYGELERAARCVLGGLCTADSRGMDELANALRRIGEGDRSLDAVLVMLEADHYIVRDRGRVEFSSGFLRDWWRRNAPDVRSWR